jgi:phage terminase small subunit
MPRERSAPVLDLSDLNIRQADFVREYLLSGNATEAYVKAGFSPNGAEVSASRLLRNAKVAAHIAAGRKKVEERAEAMFNLRLDDILRNLVAQAFGDRNELTQYRRGACRYCWGVGHHYQWKTPRELCEAAEQHVRKSEPACSNYLPPAMEGGYGYRRSARPNPVCPECDGLGIGYTWFADTTRLSPTAEVLFEGVKKTRDGIEVKMPDRTKALILLGKHLGLFDKSRDKGFTPSAGAKVQIRS